MAILYKNIVHILKQKASMLMIAFMLGMSNVILEETRMVNDSWMQTEQLEIVPDEEPQNNIVQYNSYGLNSSSNKINQLDL